jgi:hypothetical protein
MKRKFVASLLFVVFLAVTSVTVLPAQAADEAPAVTLSGWGFTVETFDEDALAYSNRQYVWKNVPEALRSWQFAKKDGGARPIIEAVPGSDGYVYLATAPQQKGINLDGWEAVQGWTFNYTAAGNTPMAVYRRPAKAGETVYIPQGNWTGGIVLAPKLTVGEMREPVYEKPPGIIIDTSPDFQKIYIGSPSIAILPNGDYVASHDLFGPGTPTRESVVLGSNDKGQTWKKLTQLDGQWWSTLFVHKGALYIIGSSERYGNVVIRRSTDGGRTWTTPTDENTGILLGDGGYHCAPVPVVVHKGRIWRAYEDDRGPNGWGTHFRAFMMSVPVDADLLKASNWTFSNRLAFDPAWLPFPAERPGWLEGNVVVTPEDTLWNILRFNDDRGDRAAIVTVSDDGKTVAFDPETGFIDFPGGRTKFTIRFDPVSKRYWSLVNKQTDPEAFRNILVLTSSADLRHWRVEKTVLEHPDQGNHAFQYVDWLFEGGDIIAVSRTAWEGSHNAHDANYMTFHRIEDYRQAR